MNKYEVQISVAYTLYECANITVEANSRDEAINQISESYEDGTLDADFYAYDTSDDQVISITATKVP